ncbi:hypothetical protein HMPREF6745_0335 [Prevotella sp. oral taxon 472 str. F0295]|nr:hypothetical protein HMPREF6745_0335 [Prevotella sp. oral taxon 472 str. F0295]
MLKGLLHGVPYDDSKQNNSVLRHRGANRAIVPNITHSSKPYTRV